MRTFKEPNLSNHWKCPICDTSKNEEVVILGIVGTLEDGNIEAEQFHLGCLEPMYDKTLGVIYQKLALQGDK